MNIYDFNVENAAGAEINGDNEDPLFTFLKSQKGFAGFDPEHPLTPMIESVLGRTAPDEMI